MKTINVIILSTLALTVSSQVNAQSPVSFGVKGGSYFSVLSGEDNSKSKVAPIGGVTVDYSIAPSWTIESGVEVTRKGVYQEDYQKVGLDSYSVDNNVNATYLQMPIHAAYKAPVGQGSNFIFYAGPYLAYGVGGKTNSKIVNKQGDLKSRSSEELLAMAGYQEEQNSFADGGLKRFDYGVSAGVGYEFNQNMDVRFSFDFGLANINNGLRDNRVSNQSGGITVGYNF